MNAGIRGLIEIEFDIVAILLLPPLICQLSNCSAIINGGHPGKAAVQREGYSQSAPDLPAVMRLSHFFVRVKRHKQCSFENRSFLSLFRELFFFYEP